MSQLLKLSSDALIEMYPDHITAIRAGLLLAICGRVKFIQDGKWQVAGQELDSQRRNYTYTVTNCGDAWTCNCKHYKNAAAAPLEFMDATARNLCKHIASVAICRGASINGLYPEPYVTIYDALSDIVASQHIPLPSESWVIPGTIVKLARVNRDGRDVVVLQTGRTRSAALVTWVSNPSLPGRGMWHLTHDAWDKYCKFVNDTFGVTPKPRQEMEQVTL